MSDNYITKEVTYAMPDKWQTTETTLGKSSTQTYTGPATVTALYDTTDERFTYAFDSSKNDNRPTPLNIVHVEIDCTESDENCIRCGVLWGGFDAPEHFEVEVGPAERLNPTVADPTHPFEVFDITSITEGYDIDSGTWGELRFAVPESDDPTMDDIRAARTALLGTCDSKISEDMPADIKQQWLDYRQALRDLPADFDGVPVHLIVFPKAPDEKNSNTEIDDEDSQDQIVKIADQGGRTDWQGQLPAGIASDE